MKRKDIEAKHALSLDELKTELRTTREKHFKLQFKHRVTPLANPMELRDLRRHVARLETWIREKSQAAQGGEYAPSAAGKAARPSPAAAGNRK